MWSQEFDDFDDSVYISIEKVVVFEPNHFSWNIQHYITCTLNDEMNIIIIISISELLENDVIKNWKLIK